MFCCVYSLAGWGRFVYRPQSTDSGSLSDRLAGSVRRSQFGEVETTLALGSVTEQGTRLRREDGCRLRDVRALAVLGSVLERHGGEFGGAGRLVREALVCLLERGDDLRVETTTDERTVTLAAEDRLVTDLRDAGQVGRRPLADDAGGNVLT